MKCVQTGSDTETEARRTDAVVNLLDRDPDAPLADGMCEGSSFQWRQPDLPAKALCENCREIVFPLKADVCKLRQEHLKAIKFFV